MRITINFNHDEGDTHASVGVVRLAAARSSLKTEQRLHSLLLV